MTTGLISVSEWWRTVGPGTGKRIDGLGNRMEVNHNKGVAQRVGVNQGTIGYIEDQLGWRLCPPIRILEKQGA